MATIRIKCDCGNPIDSNVGDILVDNQLRWYQSYHCDKCGKMIESDGVDGLPQKVRKAIMEQDGNYSLYLKDTKDRVKAIYLLKKLLHFDSSLIEPYTEKATDEVLQGTKNEVQIVKSYLESKDIECLINEK